VGQLLDRLHVTLNEGDVVEPSQSTEIASDNFRVNVYRAVPVTIVDGDKKTFTYSAAATPRSVAKQAGLEIFPEDNLKTMPTENFLTESSIGERVVIDRATPIAVNVYGMQVNMRTQAETVEELLKEKNIKLSKSDEILPAKEAKIATTTQVLLIRKGTQVQTVEETIPIPVQTVDDANLAYGSTAIRQQGAPGRKLVTYQIELANGLEIGRKIIQTVDSQPAVPRIVAKGTQPLTLSLQTWLYKLRMCESSGNYQARSRNGLYYGAYQFSIPTWNSWNTGYERADLAPPEVQDLTIVKNTFRGGGLVRQNPGCYAKTGISNYPPANH
ncbi:MAG TPA: G5 domain-containing protein, partial [Candidatus Saccharimonadales bacterium]|nr:G5 domain-containing protein [Candidatus Saccharimonadales bacterium]